MFGMLKGLGLGAGMMYFLDPSQGRRRRALVMDQFTHLTNEMQGALDVGARDLSNRSRGLMAGASSLWQADDAGDPVVVARVRSELGRIVSHPRAIHVAAQDGLVTLTGPILAHEVEPLMAAVASVRGVRDVQHMLDVHEHPGDVPALQGGGPMGEIAGGFSLETLPPAARLALGAAGGLAALKLLGIRRTLSLAALGVIGAGVAASVGYDLPGVGDWVGEWTGSAGADDAGMSPRGRSMTSSRL